MDAGDTGAIDDSDKYPGTNKLSDKLLLLLLIVMLKY